MALEEVTPAIVIAFLTSSKTVLDNYLNEPYSESGFINAAASSNESPLGKLDAEFDGEYKGVLFRIRCFKKSDNTVNAEVTGEDGYEVADFNNAQCLFLNDEIQVASCLLQNGMGKCKITENFNKILLQLTTETG